MKIDRVRYDKKFSIGPYLTDSVGIEAQVEPGETPELVLTTLKTIVEEWHYTQYRAKEVEAAEVSNAQYQKDKQAQIDKDFDNIKKQLSDTIYKEDALTLVAKSNFKYHIELNEIAKSKPSKK